MEVSYLLFLSDKSTTEKKYAPFNRLIGILMK